MWEKDNPTIQNKFIHNIVWIQNNNVGFQEAQSYKSEWSNLGAGRIIATFPDDNLPPPLLYQPNGMFHTGTIRLVPDIEGLLLRADGSAVGSQHVLP